MRRYVPLHLLLGLLFASCAHAELPRDYQVILLTENFPPFNMAANNKNFARDQNIHGLRGCEKIERRSETVSKRSRQGALREKQGSLVS